MSSFSMKREVLRAEQFTAHPSNLDLPRRREIYLVRFCEDSLHVYRIYSTISMKSSMINFVDDGISR
jgi:hypothetical protein